MKHAIKQGGRWSSRSLGSRFQHEIFYRIIRLFGRRAAYTVLFFVVSWYVLLPKTRRGAHTYLIHRFPASSSFVRFFYCFRLYWEFGKILIDRATTGILGDFVATASKEDEETLTRLQTEGHGLIFLTSHVGCWQTAAIALLHLVDAPLNLVMLQAEGDHDRQWFEHQGKRSPYTRIDPTDFPTNTVAMLTALQQGQILGIMGDRVFGDERNTLPVPFLGGNIRLPFSMYRLASATGAPIVVFFSLRTGPGRGHNRIAAVIRVPPDLGRNKETYIPYATAYAAALENVVKECPWQFFNFYDLWKDADGHQKTT